MHADINKFYKKLQDNENLKQKKYSKNAKDWYTKKLCFSTTTKKEILKSDGEPAAKKTKNRFQSFKFTLSGVSCFEMLSLSKLQNDLDLKAEECNDLHSHLDLQKESFEKQIKSALEKIYNLEKQLHYFEQKHGNLQ